ncbi:MAG: hypothetical protein HYV97_18350 [Bdellovibrio sp.]|nr:hypothetical protein [Bdellovibrio sp.]
MNLKTLKNEVLVQNAKNLGREENRILSKVLAHLLEIESRKLYLDWVWKLVSICRERAWVQRSLSDAQNRGNALFEKDTGGDPFG